MEVTKSLQPARRFRLPLGKAEGQQTARLSFGVEEEDSTGVQEDRDRRRGLAHVSAHSGHHVGRNGRTSTHDLGLLAPRQPARHHKYLQATTNSKRLAQGKLVDAILPGGVLTGSKSNLIH